MPLLSVDALQATLAFAARSCGCESYHGYICPKCRALATGEIPSGVDAAVAMGLVSWEGYGAPRLTSEGATRLAQLRTRPNERHS